MNKEELIAELQKIEGNPQIAIGINAAWGKECRVVSGITPLYNHDGHKVDSEPCILEINCDRKLFLTEEQKAAQHREYLRKKYGPLTNCSIDERFWAVNGPWFDKWNREKIEMLEGQIEKLKPQIPSIKEQYLLLNVKLASTKNPKALDLCLNLLDDLRKNPQSNS